MRKARRSHANTLAHCHKRGTTHLAERFSHRTTTRTLDYKCVNEEAGDILRANLRVGFDEFEKAAHPADVVALSAILTQWKLSDANNLLEAIDIVCPALQEERRSSN